MKKVLSDYGMVFVLIGLCVLFSVLTLKKQPGEGPEAVAELVGAVMKHTKPSDTIIAAGVRNTASEDLAISVEKKLREAGRENVRLVIGTAQDLRVALETLRDENGTLGAVACGGAASKWRLINQMPEKFPMFKDALLFKPSERRWPTFLKASNLLSVVDRIVVIAVIAIGMTMVIITGGIDLSVGSLIALSAVIGATVVLNAGGEQASGTDVALGFAAGIMVCAGIGAIAGTLVAHFKVPAFIVTLGVMMEARGIAFTTTNGTSIDRVPDSFTWLAQGTVLGIPNTVFLLAITYTLAHIFMSRTRYGRYIYAVGGNAEAARLSGVPVRGILIFVFAVSGFMAGLGGCLQASLVRAAAPNMANMYELYVIAAVVVGGTSLAGGSGRILGTLIGAFIIAVIQNGMNLLGMSSYPQMIVLGNVIVLAVLLDKARQSGGFRNLLAQP